MPILFAASRPATATLSQIRYLNPDSCINLHRPTQIDTTKTTSSSAATPSANAFDPVASDHMPHPRRSNPHSARGTDTRTPSAVSSLGGFRTPAASARGTVRPAGTSVIARHPKPFTKSNAADWRRLGEHRRCRGHRGIDVFDPKAVLAGSIRQANSPHAPHSRHWAR